MARRVPHAALEPDTKRAPRGANQRGRDGKRRAKPGPRTYTVDTRAPIQDAVDREVSRILATLTPEARALLERVIRRELRERRRPKK